MVWAGCDLVGASGLVAGGAALYGAAPPGLSIFGTEIAVKKLMPSHKFAAISVPKVRKGGYLAASFASASGSASRKKSPIR